MDYPHEIEEADYSGFESWSWVWAHSPLNQNGLTVDEVATGKGWGDNRGYGECLTFKGGEDAGIPGSGFQVLEVLDHYSWARVDKQVTDWRRVVIGVEGPNGHPYALDLTHLVGGQRHALYNQAWAQRAAAQLPEAAGQAEDLSKIFFGDELPEDTADYRNFAKLRNVERFTPEDPHYGVTWQQDYGAWGRRDVGGKPYQRPVPEDVGKVRLRFIGLNQGDGRTELLSGKGPWIGWLRQGLPNGQQVNGNVSFVDARDFLVEYRTGGTKDEPLQSSFIHVLEGYREGENSAIVSMERISATSGEGPARQVVVVELRLAAGHTDTVIYQSQPGTIELPDGTRTDARFALVRRDADGQVIAADAVRCSSFVRGEFSVAMPGDFTGTIVDVIGDITGTRQESAVIIKPDKPWPMGTSLHGRQLNIRVESDLRAPCDEGYRVAKTTLLQDGLVRIDLQDYAPFAVSWHEVTELPADRANVIRTWRPMVDHGNGPWYGGMKLWFPERGKTYTMKAVNEVRGGYGGDRVELVEDVNLAAEGIKPGDWYVIYGVRPGLQVRVANDFAWRREPATDWRQYSLRATGAVTVTDPALSAGCSYQTGDAPWQHVPTGTPLRVTAADQGVTQVMVGKPTWLNLNDAAAPDLVQLTLDGQMINPAEAADLGWIDPPKQAVVALRDAENRLNGASLEVNLNGQCIDASGVVKTTFGSRGDSVTVEVDLASATAADREQPRRHTLIVAVSDRSVARHSARITLSYITKVPLDPDATYLSDLKPVKAFAHGGPNIDRDYRGDVATIGDRIYPKCVMICPEPSAEGAHGEIIFELPAGAPRILHSDIGIEEMTGTRGTVVFMVQCSAFPAGPWETLYTSPVMRGGTDPLTVETDLGEARYLRLYTTDAGDGINSDHALWGNARLE
ncbi:MAG: NPCBM/NEW2 domain-containing protein, partial [Lentisphaerae bacterium]|nr:NPCBM/NEW2 domain-containing protein [Lentisphaerota bacterium]